MTDPAALLHARQTVLRDLLIERSASGHWVGRLSSSALSTATATSALALADQHSDGNPQHRELIDQAIHWLAGSVNPDGGWGDTDRSRSNIATTMLVLAAFRLAGAAKTHQALMQRADDYVAGQGGVAGLRRRYGRDKTFAVPILTNCALAGMVAWREVSPLPFELACSPHGLLRFLRLPVVSYALPALVAIGQARYFHAKPKNPVTRLVRRLAIKPSMKKLRAMQPVSGGYLEAAPLTSFVVMSLASTGRAEHPVARDGLRFLRDSVRDDGSWPIDTNLATWNTTLAVNAMAEADLNEYTPDDADRLRDWILTCQHRTVHPFTQAAAGGWGWTDRSGAVPDADDTAGALLALKQLQTVFDRGATGCSSASVDELTSATRNTGCQAASGTREPSTQGSSKGETPVAPMVDGIGWLLRLQNSDGGWPTFCRGWGALPFDRSGADLTAHAIRALHAWQELAPSKIDKAIRRGFAYLQQVQRADGDWTPLWFGNQHDPNEENPVYGTARVLMAYRDLGRLDDQPARRGMNWLCHHQNEDGGWGGDLCRVSTVEETAVAVEALFGDIKNPSVQVAADKGLAWLVRAVAENRHRQGSPIGFYFAKLWYYESMYPLVFTLSALTRAKEHFDGLKTGPS